MLNPCLSGKIISESIKSGNERKLLGSRTQNPFLLTLADYQSKSAQNFRFDGPLTTGRKIAWKRPKIFPTRRSSDQDFLESRHQDREVQLIIHGVKRPTRCNLQWNPNESTTSLFSLSLFPWDGLEGETIYDLHFHIAWQPGLSRRHLAHRLREESSYIFLL